MKQSLAEYIVELTSNGYGEIRFFTFKDWPTLLRISVSYNGIFMSSAVDMYSLERSILPAEDLIKLELEQIVITLNKET